MSKTRLIAVFGVLLGVVLFAAMGMFGIKNDPSKLPSALIGKPFPEFSNSSLDDPNTLITRKDLLGRPALVNVWANWCPECKIEHPILNALTKRGIVIHGINYKDSDPSIRRWSQDLANPYQLSISDPKGTLGFELGVYGAPETYIIDKRGYVVYRHTGAVTDRVWREKLAPIYQGLLDE